MNTVNIDVCALVWPCIAATDAYFTIESCKQTSTRNVHIVGYFHPGATGDIIAALYLVFGSRFHVQRATIAANADELGYHQYSCILRLRRETVLI